VNLRQMQQISAAYDGEFVQVQLVAWPRGVIPKGPGHVGRYKVSLAVHQEGPARTSGVLLQLDGVKLLEEQLRELRQYMESHG
jgi:hypothetical protein